MAKKKTKNLLGMLLPMVAALLAVVAVCLMAAPAAVVTDTNVTYTGAQLTFGYTRDVIIGDAEVFKFSFLNFIPYILLVAGIVFSVLTVLGKLGKIAPFISAVCYLVAGVLFFLVITMSVLPIESVDLSNAFKDTLSLGAGAIVAGIISILAALSSVATVFVKK